MFKKIVLFFTVILLALPVFADETDIIPVMWLFNDLNFQTIYELKLSTESPDYVDNRLRTFAIK